MFEKENRFEVIYKEGSSLKDEGMQQIMIDFYIQASIILSGKVVMPEGFHHFWMKMAM